jgi:hypothetical protein
MDNYKQTIPPLNALARKPTAADAKAKRTDDAATEIINAEAAARARKTARLRALRLEKEAAEPPVQKRAAPKRQPARRKR